MQKPLLFSPLKLRGVTAPNRCVVSPMVQFRATDGLVNDFHLVHLGKFALGKFGIVFTENCAVEPRGRVTQGDLGLWDDNQIASHKRLTAFIKGEEHWRRRRSRIPAARARRRARSTSRANSPGGRGLEEVGSGRPHRSSCCRWLAEATRSVGERRLRSWSRSLPRRRSEPMRRATTCSKSMARTAISLAQFLVVDQQHAQRQVRWRPRRPHAFPARCGARRASGVAREQAAVRTCLRGRWRRRLGCRRYRLPSRRS